MIHKVKQGMIVFRGAALAAVLAGAAGSVALTLHAGRHNHSRLLLGLFALWVFSPFLALAVIHSVSNGWPVVTRATLYTVMLVIAVGALAIYGYVALGPPRTKTAAVFVVVPPVSSLLTAIAVSVAALVSRRLPHRGMDS